MNTLPFISIQLNTDVLPFAISGTLSYPVESIGIKNFIDNSSGVTVQRATKYWMSFLN